MIVSLRDLNMEIYVRRDGADRNLSRSPSIDWYASWSPDGAQVLFASDRVDGQHDIYVTDAAGEGEPRRLTDAPQDDWSPVFTRDSRVILFASERDGLMQGGATGLYAIDWAAAQANADAIPAAVPVESLTDPADAALDSGAVTQNGVTVFMSRRDGNWELYAETSTGVVNLTQDPASDLFPLWMPEKP
ncbi:MAG: PD40 domain-containing protein [Chloroflexi bacterium]|nr:PD40 domain-containing protein [Chloroflexota bacterium]